jgi:hypothetical protein
MARTIPLLPCASIDDVIGFYRVLGFEQSHRQLRPNPYAVVRRDDIELHFFGMSGFDPEASYGSCIVLVPDVLELYESFAAGMRAAYGKLLVAGIPRMTRPRKRKNTGQVSAFSVVDPGGNWIRVFADGDPGEDTAQEEQGPLARTFENAVVLGDSKGDHRQAARILDGALRRHGPSAPVVDRVEALVYRAELAVRLGEGQRAASLLTEAHDIELADDERDRLEDALANAAELLRALEVPDVPGGRPRPDREVE